MFPFSHGITENELWSDATSNTVGAKENPSLP